MLFLKVGHKTDFGLGSYILPKDVQASFTTFSTTVVNPDQMMSNTANIHT